MDKSNQMQDQSYGRDRTPTTLRCSITLYSSNLE